MSWSRRSCFIKTRSGSSPCAAAKFRTGKSRTSCTRGVDIIGRGDGSNSVHRLPGGFSERQRSPQVVFKLRLRPVGGLKISSSPSFTFCPMAHGLSRPWHCCLYRCSWGFVLQQSLCLGLIRLISLSAKSGLEVQGLGGIGVLCFQSLLLTERADSTGLVSWLSSMGVTPASAVFCTSGGNRAHWLALTQSVSPARGQPSRRSGCSVWQHRVHIGTFTIRGCVNVLDIAIKVILIWKCGGVTAGRFSLWHSFLSEWLALGQVSLLYGLDVRLDNPSAWLWC